MPVDLNSVNRNDLGVMGAGVVAFIASFLPYWGVSFGGSVQGVHVGGSASITAWHSYAILGLLLIFAAAGLIAVRTFAASSLPEMPAGVHVIAAALAGLGTLLVILRAFTYPHASYPGGSYGVRWGGYVLFIAGIAATAFAVLGMRESGETVPGIGSRPSSPPAPPPSA